MKYYVLDQEEQEIEDAFASGKLVSVKNLAKEIKRIKKIAEYTLSKTKNINIRLPQKIILKLKAKAISEGMPYQTLAASALYKFANQ